MNNKLTQKQKAENFLALHQQPLFVLANAWDVISARIFETVGFKAVGTTSAGVAATLGYADGQKISLSDTANVVKSISDFIEIPVSADIEAGYATSIEGVVKSIVKIIDAGAVGINLEDSTGQVDEPFFNKKLQMEKITAIREKSKDRGIHLVINARTDLFMLSKKKKAMRLADAIERGNAYVEAGADCIFVPDLEDLGKDDIKLLVNEIDAPLNIIAGENTPPLQELKEIGVTRVSLGPRPMRASLALLRKIAREIMEQGTFKNMTADVMTYEEVNNMLRH